MPLKGFDDDLDDEDEFEHDPPHTRHFEDLSREEKQILMKITSPQDIKSCEIIDDWSDDHQLCLGVNLNGVAFGMWWIGWEVAGAFRYWDSPSAKQSIVQYMQETVRNHNEYGEDTGDEITPEDLPPRPQ